MGADGDRLEGGVGGVGRDREEGEGEGRVSINGDRAGMDVVVGRCKRYTPHQKSQLTSSLAKISCGLCILCLSTVQSSQQNSAMIAKV